MDALNLHVVRDRHWYFVPCSATHDSAKVSCRKNRQRFATRSHQFSPICLPFLSDDVCLQRFEDGLEWLCEELEVPKELEVQHPNVMALAFPCFQQASESEAQEPRSAGATQSAASAKNSADLVASAVPAEGKTTDSDPEAASRSESKSTEGKFADAV